MTPFLQKGRTLIVRDGLDKLGDSREFAESMTSKVQRLGATQKQRYWLEKLAGRAMGDEPAARAQTPVGDLKGVMELFDRARKHLKAPAIVISPDDPRETHPREWKLSVAGPTARVPGSINVVQKAARRGLGENLLSEEDQKWFGRILLDGQFEASPREPTPDDLIPFLQRFAAEPAKMAAEYGKLNGRCCFCARKLTDERSTAVGYGERCADRWGVKYPTLAQASATQSNLFAA